jgi:two-component system phosphate regulon sensor histidine kinase PhoR
MKRTIFIKTFFSYILLISLVFALLFFLFHKIFTSFHINQLKERLLLIGKTAEPLITKYYEQNDIKNLQYYLEKIGGKATVRYSIIDSKGFVRADSQEDVKKMDNHKNRPEVVEAMSGNIGKSTRFSYTTQANSMYMAMAVLVNSSDFYVLRLSMYLKDVQSIMNDIRFKAILLLIVILILSLSLAYFFSRNIAVPIREILHATRRFSAGDNNVKVYMKNKDELQEVAESFNAMVMEKRNLFNELTDKHEELQAIMTEMKEGLLVLEKSGRVVLSNLSLEKICGHQIRQGAYYWESLRILNFDAQIAKAFAEGESFSAEIEIENKYVLMGFSLANQKQKLLVTFRDITELKQLELIKKEFVSNLTHELKTPLTAIKGFVETLEDEEEIKNKNYIDIIKRHTNRMNQIVSDLMVLSELEERKAPLEIMAIDLKRLLENILKIFQEKIKEKQLHLVCEIADDLPKIPAEQFKLEQLFINLIDNAVKYTENGSIIVRAFIAADKLIIEVTDTGIGIPEKAIFRIFERFYVVDKSRSRRLGGTGLGLSIVKHIVQLHQGTIEVKSQLGKGTS